MQQDLFLLRQRLRTSPVVGPFRILQDTEVGQGSTGTVRLAVKTSDPSFKAAAKIVFKRCPLQDQSRAEDPLREIRILQQLAHKNIVRILHVEEETNFLFIFLEWMELGDVYTFIGKNGALTELLAAKLFKQMTKALEFCHSKKICHHDFKLENCVIDGDFNLRVIDFGYAIDYASMPEGERFHHYVGSPAYSAQEVLFRKPHTESVDVFSLGVCLYYMLCGTYPFCDEARTTYQQLCRNVRQGVVEFPDHVTAEARDLIVKMLAKDERILLAEVRHHPWLLAQKNQLREFKAEGSFVYIQQSHVHRLQL